VEACARTVARAAQGHTIVVEKSTLPVRTAEVIQQILSSAEGAKSFAVLSNPEFLAEGTAIARKRVARPMRQAGLRGVSRRRFPITTRREPTNRPANDLVGRVFTAPAPNLLWVWPTSGVS
jgi:hypothetical protein